jgi:hypothetical protein
LLVDRRGVPHRAGHWAGGRQREHGGSTEERPLVSKGAVVPKPAELPSGAISLARMRRGA